MRAFDLTNNGNGLSLHPQMIGNLPWVQKSYLFFYLILGCPTANFGTMSSGQLHSPVVNCCLNYQSSGHREPAKGVGSLTPTKRLVGFEPGHSDPIATPYPTLPKLHPMNKRCLLKNENKSVK